MDQKPTGGEGAARGISPDRGMGDNSEAVEKLSPAQRAGMVFEQANRFFEPVHNALADGFMQARIAAVPSGKQVDLTGFDNAILSPIRQKCVELAEAHVSEYEQLIERYTKEAAR